jgi:hypothetical protein
MEIKINIKTDSDNTYPQAGLVVTIPSGDSEDIYFNLEGPDREISVSKAELVKVLKLVQQD